MSKDMQTILISLCTSLLVSLFTFILGLKSGKNQADRCMVQKLYKNIFSHFEDLKDFIEKNLPRRWSNYEKVKIDIHSYKYISPISKLKMSGELLHIKKSISKEIIELEKSLLVYGSEVFESIESIHNILINEKHLYIDGFKFGSDFDKENQNFFNTANPTECRSYIRLDYRDFYDKDKILRSFKHLVTKDACGIMLELYTNRITFQCNIYPESLTVSPEVYVEKIYKSLNSEIENFSRLYNLKTKYIQDIDKLNKKISKRVREPFSFWETIGGAFSDIFK